MKFLKEYIEQVKAQQLYRAPALYMPLDATHVTIAEKTYLMLAANNYLGLTHCQAVQQAAMDAIACYGTGSGGARLTTGNHPLYSLLEQELAAFKGTEAAVVFNTGYMANIGTISALMDKKDVVFSDELNHASIIDGCRLSRAQTVVFRHSDMDHLDKLLRETCCQGKRLIVVDGVFSMDGDIAPLDAIVDLAERYEAMVMVDDAHGTGVIGGGRGTAAHFGLKGRVHILLGTLSKALAAEGGYVAGSRSLIEYIINKARSFIFSTALSPAVIAAAHAALREVQNHPDLVDKLRENASYMRQQLVVAGLSIEDGETPIIPIVVGSAGRAIAMAAELKNAGIIATAIRPPTVPPDASRLRVTVSAAHTKAELAWAVEQIQAAAIRLQLTEG